MKKRLFAFLNNSVNKRFAESDILHRCSIGVGYANGYVAVPPGHPLHGKHYDEANNVIDIHGGLTFGEPIEEIKADGWRNDTECIGFDNFDEIPKDYWVFGFDTMHYDDGPHLDRDWCINETKDLLKQLNEL
jgi:hypothetical protein